MTITTSHASKSHTRTQKSQYTQPKQSIQSIAARLFEKSAKQSEERSKIARSRDQARTITYDDIFGGLPDPQETGDYSWINNAAKAKKQAQKQERDQIEQQQNCTVVATANEVLLKQLGCHSETFDIAEEDCYQEWITEWYKGKKQLKTIQHGYYYIVPK